MNKLILSQLEQHLYAAAIFYAASWTPPNSKAYIFGTPFLKRCSDAFDDRHERIIKENLVSMPSENSDWRRTGKILKDYGGSFE